MTPKSAEHLLSPMRENHNRKSESEHRSSQSHLLLNNPDVISANPTKSPGGSRHLRQSEDERGTVPRLCDEADDSLFEDVNAGISRGSVGISTLVDRSTRHLLQKQPTKKSLPILNRFFTSVLHTFARAASIAIRKSQTF
jgi:hypothetical protein